MEQRQDISLWENAEEERVKRLQGLGRTSGVAPLAFGGTVKDTMLNFINTFGNYSVKF